MTFVGIYLIGLYLFGIGAQLYYAGQGGTFYTSGNLIFGALCSTINMVLIITFGTGSL